MATPDKSEMLQAARPALERHLAVGSRVAELTNPDLPAIGADLMLRISPPSGGPTVAVAACLKQQFHPGSVAAMRARFEELADRLRYRGGKLHPVVVAPFLTPHTLDTCRAQKISAWDLCGNCCIQLPGLYIFVSGASNRFVNVRDVKSVFSAKASRIPRLLLTHPQNSWNVTALAKAAEINKGYTSRVVAKLETTQMAHRDSDGFLHASDVLFLLRSWTASYHPSAGRPGRYFAPMSRPYEVLERVGRVLAEAEPPGAVTGPAGANLFDAGLRLQQMHVFWHGDPDALARRADLQPVERGANVFVYRPYDAFVCRELRFQDGVPVVSDVQLYLDMCHLGGRAQEQAQPVLRRLTEGKILQTFLNWSP